VTLRSGRYGPYVNHAKTNATLPRGADLDAVTLAQALEWIAEKESKPSSGRRPTRAAKPKSPSAKPKTPAKKTAAKKAKA
jgi:DNA topoisomerase-1